MPFLSLTFGGMDDGLAVREGVIGVLTFGERDDGLAVREGVIGVVGCIFCAGSWGLICVRGGGLGCAVGLE